jgi:hypothetical protein
MKEKGGQIKKNENELAKAVIEWLRADSWEVFEEVAPYGAGGPRADIVARRNKIIWIIETKRQFNLEVLEQASNWRFYGHFVSLAVWKPKKNISIIERICRKFDLGFITAAESVFRDRTYDIHERCESRFYRQAQTGVIAKMLVDQTPTTERPKSI